MNKHLISVSAKTSTKLSLYDAFIKSPIAVSGFGFIGYILGGQIGLAVGILLGVLIVYQLSLDTIFQNQSNFQ